MFFLKCLGLANGIFHLVPPSPQSYPSSGLWRFAWTAEGFVATLWTLWRLGKEKLIAHDHHLLGSFLGGFANKTRGDRDVLIDTFGLRFLKGIVFLRFSVILV